MSLEKCTGWRNEHPLQRSARDAWRRTNEEDHPDWIGCDHAGRPWLQRRRERPDGRQRRQRGERFGRRRRRRGREGWSGGGRCDRRRGGRRSRQRRRLGWCDGRRGRRCGRRGRFSRRGGLGWHGRHRRLGWHGRHRRLGWHGRRPPRPASARPADGGNAVRSVSRRRDADLHLHGEWRRRRGSRRGSGHLLLGVQGAQRDALRLEQCPGRHARRGSRVDLHRRQRGQRREGPAGQLDRHDGDSLAAAARLLHDGDRRLHQRHLRPAAEHQRRRRPRDRMQQRDGGNHQQRQLHGRLLLLHGRWLHHLADASERRADGHRGAGGDDAGDPRQGDRLAGLHLHGRHRRCGRQQRRRRCDHVQLGAHGTGRDPLRRHLRERGDARHGPRVDLHRRQRGQREQGRGIQRGHPPPTSPGCC